MNPKIVDQVHIKKFTILALSEDIPPKPYNTYVIDGVPYKPVPFYARPLTDRTIMNVIAIQASGDFIGKTVLFEWR